MKLLQIFIALYFISNTACYADAGPKIRVIATIFPLADITRLIGGEKVDVHLLMDAGQGPHTYEPTPGDAKKIAKADVVVIAGFGLEHWLEKILRGGTAGRMEINCAKAVASSINGSAGIAKNHDGENPHYWLDPLIMIDVVHLIADSLAAYSPSQKEYFKARASDLARELAALNDEIATLLGSGDMRGSYVAFHNAWGYFARRYQLHEVGVIEQAPGREPSARQIVKLAEKIKSYGVGAVLVEPQFSPRLGATLAQEAGVKIVTVDPIGGVPGRDAYIKLMRWNARQFKKAFERE